MIQADPYPFDFRNAGTADTVVRMLKEWLQKTTDTFSDSWEAVSNSIVNLECKGVLSRTFEEGVQALPTASVGFEILIGGDDAFTTLGCIANQDLVALIGAIFDTNLGEYEDRKLTNIEVSLCGMIYETLASALGAAWFGKETLPITLGEFEDPPQFSRSIPVKDLVLSTKIQLVVADTVAHIIWLVPRKEIEKLIESTTGLSLKKQSNDPADVIRQVSIEVVGMLGDVEMTMRNLKELTVGDVLALNQKIDRPVEVFVDNQKFFAGWPGRVGRKQGIEIAEVL